MRVRLLLILCVSLAACGPAEPPSPPEQPEAFEPTTTALALQRVTEDISGTYLREVITEIADDRYAGRGPGSEGDELAREWLAEELQRSGYEPGAADGSWQQPFDLVGLQARMPADWRFDYQGSTLSIPWWDDYIAASGLQEQRISVADAEVVFVGYGIEAPEYGWNDFKHQDLRGKILLMLNNDPDWDPDLFEGDTRLYYGRWVYKFESAARQGAAGAIIIHTSPSAAYPWQVVQTSWSGTSFELPAKYEPRVAIKGWLTETAAERLVALSGRRLSDLVESARDREFEPVPLGITSTLAFDNSLTRTRSANVLGLLPGSDPELVREVIVYTAHHDHLGIGAANADGDTIYNGARDNAAGVAQLLAIARAIKSVAPDLRRSVLVNFVGAEEQGLLGSQYYAQHPTFPPGRIVANINYDGGNIWGATRDLTLIGKGKSTLDALVEEIAATQGRVVNGDQFPDRGTFYRSDQFNFAKIGVPAVFLNAGVDFVDREPGWGRERLEEYVAKNYHQPSDELDPGWNFDGMVQDARIGFLLGYRLAIDDGIPEWLPGDEFEATRLAALAEVNATEQTKEGQDDANTH